MGAVKRDLFRSGREYDAIYDYTDEGIATLLKDVYRFKESRHYKGDIDATAILTDLKLALDSDCLTPRMRQVVALYYFVGLTEEETADILGITERKAVNKSLSSSLERIAEQMSKGSYRKKGHAEISTEYNTPLYNWLTAVAYGDAPIYEVPGDVFTEILNRSRHSDKNADETLRQRLEGSSYKEDYADAEEYPALTEDQFKWKDRRMSFKSEIYPRGDVIGSRKVSIKLRDGDESGNEWILEKRKLFARGGN
jgi:hypothetical protein